MMIFNTKIIKFLYIFISLTTFGFAESSTLSSQQQELNIRLEYRQLADYFHLVDHLTESTPNFFLITGYKKLWVECFGLSEVDIGFFKQYKDLRLKYKNTSFFDETTPSEKSGLFAPNPKDIPDIIADAFYTSVTIENALHLLEGKLEVHEIKFIKYFFESYKEKLSSFIKFDNDKLNFGINYFNNELNSPNAISAFSKSIDFYKSGTQQFKSILVFWCPSGFHGACYGDHLQVKIPIDNLPVNGQYVMHFLASVILHEATHHISGSASSEQKLELSRAFLNVVKSVDESHFLNAVEEPLVMAHQMRFVKNAYPEIYSENAEWFNYPLAKEYLNILENYIEEGKSIDKTFMLKLADIYTSYFQKSADYETGK